MRSPYLVLRFMHICFGSIAQGTNLLEAARLNEAKRYFYASTACVYNEDLQLDPSNPGLKETDAWPAKPQVCFAKGFRRSFVRPSSCSAQVGGVLLL